MKKVTVYIITALTITMFILLMNAGNYLKSPRGQDDNFPLHIKLLTENIKNEQWQKAGENLEKLALAWKKIVPRIQYSVEKDEINAINVNLARLKSYITNRDKSNALAELNEAFEHWNDLNR
jgi:hypothetical protein